MVRRLTIPGRTQPKERPRATRTGHVYTPKRTAEYEKRVRSYYMKEHGTACFDGMPIRVYIVIYMAIPKSAKKQERQDMMDGFILPTKRPDIDNLAKGILDALNGLAYADDRQIAELTIHKRYDDGAGERAYICLADE